jgi:hypothetical protein
MRTALQLDPDTLAELEGLPEGLHHPSRAALLAFSAAPASPGCTANIGEPWGTNKTDAGWVVIALVALILDRWSLAPGRRLRWPDQPAG